MDTHHDLAEARLWVRNLFKLHDFWLTKRMDTNRFHRLSFTLLKVRDICQHSTGLVARRVHIVPRSRLAGQADPRARFCSPGADGRASMANSPSVSLGAMGGV